MHRALPLSLAFALAACSSAPKPAPMTNQPPAGGAPEANPAVALALVVNGQEVWIGNDEYETDDAARYSGALTGLRAALAAEPPASGLPSGSEAVLVTYSVGAEIRAPLGPVGTLTADALGKQADYRGKIGTDLVQGVQLALAELAKATAPRHVLVVIGDGNDTNNEAARTELETLRRSSPDVEIYALVHKSAVSLDSDIMDALTPNVIRVSSRDGFGAALGDVWRRAAGGR